jgi:hypothetical protein
MTISLAFLALNLVKAAARESLAMIEQANERQVAGHVTGD